MLVKRVLAYGNFSVLVLYMLKQFCKGRFQTCQPIPAVRSNIIIKISESYHLKN